MEQAQGSSTEWENLLSSAAFASDAPVAAARPFRPLSSWIRGQAPLLSKRGGKQKRSRTQANVQSARARRQRLEQSLQRLHCLLGALPTERRRFAIQGFSECLRRALLLHMQVGAPRCDPTPLRDGMKAGGKSGLAPRRVAAKKLGDANPGCCMEEKAIARSSWRKRCRHEHTGQVRLRLGLGGVSCVRLGGSVRFFARIKIDGIAISSRSTPCREDAERLRRLLAQLREHRPLSDDSVNGNSKWLQSVFLGASPEGIGSLSAEHGDAVEAGLSMLARTSWHFRVLVDARRWVGQILSTRQLQSITEAVKLRDKLQAARLQGWSALRGALLVWAPCRREPRHPSTDPSCISSSARWLANVEARRDVVLGLQALRMRRHDERQLARAKANAHRVERRVARLVQQLERLCTPSVPRKKGMGQVPQAVISHACSFRRGGVDLRRSRGAPGRHKVLSAAAAMATEEVAFPRKRSAMQIPPSSPQPFPQSPDAA